MNKLAICTDREDSVKDYDKAIEQLHIIDDVSPELLEEINCIDINLSNIILADELNSLNSKYPETKFLKKYYSEEAWRVTEAIGNMLIRLKNFFTRTLQYIKVFVVIRIGAAETIIKRWAGVCDAKHDEVERYLKENDKKEISVTSLTELMSVSQALYKEYQDQFTNVCTMTVDTAVSANNANELVAEPGRYQDWLKLLEKVEAENPRNKETNGKSALSLIDGKWGDSVEIMRLAKAVAQARIVVSDLNKLDNNAKKIISELEQSDNTPPAQKTDNDAGKMKVTTEDVLKRRKLDFLRKFSKEAMTKLIGTFTTYTSYAGQQCEQFVKLFDKASQKVANAQK